MSEKQPQSSMPSFGKPIELDLLLGFADVDAEDIANALQWWDEHASEEWVGALDNKPIGGKKKR